ncbi:MAG: NADH-quinone oxidoreductase subunit NuoH [Candidatus Eisenbacteria bacterium]|nr:NADH-quinone oxidoreductase subunit NuoH [Candidatus Eisenbacteria bacterium]
MNATILFLAVLLLKCLILIGVVLGGMAYMTLVERKLIGRFQYRYGPNRVGPYGLLQPIADGLKLLFKEDIFPSQADKFLHLLAPVIAFITALLTFAVVPFGPSLYLTDINVAILYVLAVTSLGVYAIVLAGWSSNSKYPLLGGLRSSAQMVSYELSVGLAVVVVVLLSGSFSLVEIVKSQENMWFAFKQPVAFALFLISSIAEINRVPFDLPEAESELVSGFHTEYSGLRFAMFYIAEYTNMIAAACIATTLFLGGWLGPFLPAPFWFGIKVLFLLVVFVWIRATLPRLRYDQLMKFGWKVLFPIGVLNVIATAFFLAGRGQ